MKKLMLFSMWLAASVAAVGVAWAGVSVVDNQVVAPPSAGGLSLPAATSTTASITVTSPPSSSPTTTSGSVPATASSTTSAPQPAGATTKTFTLTGGTAAISFSASNVEVLWATPNPGFDVRIEPESPGVKVEFRADHHRSRVDAWWSAGPQHDIREEPRK